MFVYKNEFSPATIPGTIGQKPETASQLSLQNHHIFAITKETQSGACEGEWGASGALSDVAIEDTLNVQAIFRFIFVYLRVLRASDTLKVQTDYLGRGGARLAI